MSDGGTGVSREQAEAAIEVLLQERRTFPPPQAFVEQAVVRDRSPTAS
jgi:hypothetical protein